MQIQKNLEQRHEIARALSPYLQRKEFPPSASIALSAQAEAPLEYEITYTLDPSLQAEAQRLLQNYKPDFGAIFMMDAITGKTLAMAHYSKTEINNLNLRATYPAASVFKIVTATTAIDKAGLTPGHNISFNGGNYTLYRKNVLSEKVNRWTRTITLREAFAKSINTAFGRLSLSNFEPEDLNQYAFRFGFNQNIPSDFEVETSLATVPTEKGFEFTEVASGYNRINRMSPVHGAMIAGSIVNEGRMMVPFLVESLRDSKNNLVFQGQPLEKGFVMSPDSAKKVKELMEQTILSGTSKKSFRSLVKNKKFKEVEMGGKTGHLTGDNPRGRVDWFVGYAFDDEKRVSLAAITVNVDYWTVKSSFLGQSMFRKYFESILQARTQASNQQPQAKF